MSITIEQQPVSTCIIIILGFNEWLAKNNLIQLFMKIKYIIMYLKYIKQDICKHEMKYSFTPVMLYQQQIVKFVKLNFISEN